MPSTPPAADQVAPTPYSVRELLAADLDPSQRMSALQGLCARFTGQPLEDTVADLRGVLAGQISMEDYRRLHILISHLYHRCGASIPATAELRAEVNSSLRHGDPVASSPERG